MSNTKNSKPKILQSGLSSEERFEVDESFPAGIDLVTFGMRAQKWTDVGAWGHLLLKEHGRPQQHKGRRGGQGATRQVCPRLDRGGVGRQVEGD